MKVRGTAPHHCAVEQEEMMMRGMGPCHRVVEWKETMVRGKVNPSSLLRRGFKPSLLPCAMLIIIFDMTRIGPTLPTLDILRYLLIY
jgi:hypothetical protein